MKVIITGATGLAGKEIVKQCLADPRITKVVILTRRAVSGDVESHPKSEVLLHQDFTRYSGDLLRRLDGAEACFWAIGSRLDQSTPDKQALHEVNVDYPLIAARTFSNTIAPRVPAGKKFNFIYLSNKHSEKNQAKAFLFPSDAKRNRNEAEKGLCEIADVNATKFNVWILRPGNFVMPDAPKKRRLGGLSGGSGIEVSRFAKAAVRVACEGWKERVIDNDALMKM